MSEHSPLVSWSRASVIMRAMTRAAGTLRSVITASSARRRVAHSDTTRKAPRKPDARNRRQSSVPFRQPAAHSISSCLRNGSNELARGRKTSVRPPRSTSRTILRDCPVCRTIPLMDIPCPASVRIVAFAASRRRQASCWRCSTLVSAVGSLTSARSPTRIACHDSRTAVRNAALAFSIRCQRSAICMAWGRPRAAAWL